MKGKAMCRSLGRFLDFICLFSLLLCLFAVFAGAGCRTLVSKKTPEPGRKWICDHVADEVMLGGDYEAGISLHERFLEKEPENALALYHLGYAYGQIGEHLREVSYYEKAIVLGFREEGMFFNMGMTYCEIGQAEKATSAFKEALKINPGSADNHFGLGMAYHITVTNGLAEEELLKAIEIDPRHADARLLLSLLYADWGELQKAAGQLRKVLEIDPTNDRARKFLERIEKE